MHIVLSNRGNFAIFIARNLYVSILERERIFRYFLETFFFFIRNRQCVKYLSNEFDTRAALLVIRLITRNKLVHALILELDQQSGGSRLTELEQTRDIV